MSCVLRVLCGAISRYAELMKRAKNSYIEDGRPTSAATRGERRHSIERVHRALTNTIWGGPFIYHADHFLTAETAGVVDFFLCLGLIVVRF